MTSRIANSIQTPESSGLQSVRKSISNESTKILDESVMFIAPESKPEDSKEETIPPEKAKKWTENMNEILETTQTHLRFQFHEKLEEYYVTIVDSKTDKVVREIPSKKLMDIHAAMLDFVGLLVDKKI